MIRWATPGDEAAWRGLWAAYLAFYDHPLPEAQVAFTWARLMDPAHALKARLAEVEGRVLGFAIHQHHPSTWVMGDDCYLEDLFVSEAARGQGLGRALIDDLRDLAKGRGWHRLYWHTDEGNQRARRLYESYAAPDGHIRFRFALR
jgi:GNAT superfamily N-acetyltransferase